MNLKYYTVLRAYLLLNQFNGHQPHLKLLNFTVLNCILYESTTVLERLDGALLEV